LNRLDWVYAGSAACALGAGGLAFWLRRRRRNPEEAERRRREYVNRVGRIAAAEILEIVELEREAPRRPVLAFLRHSLPAPGPQSVRRLILYGYTVSGVRYETAQELFGLPLEFPLPELGELVSVKYESARPGNSILVAENWSGLSGRGPEPPGPGKER
jgi:hypothetical protein